MKPQPPFAQVFSKELKEMARDKRVRTTALVMPLAMVALMILLFGTISASIGGKSKQTIGVVESSSPLVAQLQKDPRLTVLKATDEAAGQKMIRDGKARLVVEFQKPQPNGQVPVALLFDPKEDVSDIAKGAVRQAFDPYTQDVVQKVLASRGLSKDRIEPLLFKDTPVKVGEGAGAGGFVVSLLPYILVLLTFTGGASIASDLVAGEKEKSTLETLLITPVPRTEIVFGKFLALTVICLVSGLSAVVGLALASTLHLPGTELLFAGGLGLTPKMIATVLVLLLPLVAFFAGLLVAVSSFARNTREAQTYLGVVNLAVVLPAAFSQVLGFTDIGKQAWINFVPVLGTAANIRTAFQGKAAVLAVSESVVVGVLLAAVMLKVAVHLFNREQVLARI